MASSSKRKAKSEDKREEPLNKVFPTVKDDFFFVPSSMGCFGSLDMLKRSASAKARLYGKTVKRQEYLNPRIVFMETVFDPRLAEAFRTECPTNESEFIERVYVSKFD